jgi:hypothetical protein
LRDFVPEESESDEYLSAGKGLVRAIYDSVEHAYSDTLFSPSGGLTIREGVEKPYSEEHKKMLRGGVRGRTVLLARELASSKMGDQSPLYNLFFKPYVRNEVSNKVGRLGERVDRWLAEKTGLSRAIDAKKTQFDSLEEHYQTELEKYVDGLRCQE